MMFEAFPKIPRLRREVTITEKIDGTNAQIYIEQVPQAVFDEPHPNDLIEAGWIYVPTAGVRMVAGSRTRWICPTDDNFGFAGWMAKNASELAKLGPGRHFGEWWGAGIQRRYGLDHKRFSLFNVDRWGPHNPNTPACCHVVPIMARGRFDDNIVDECLKTLRATGSQAAPGFMQPEGIVVYSHASRTLSKVTCEKDDEPKGKGD